MKLPDAREVIAVLIVGGCFGLLGGYLVSGGKLDTGTGVALVAFCSGPIGAIIGFYFGRTNGAATALATSTTALANIAIQQTTARRASDPTVLQSAGPVTVVPNEQPPAPAPTA